MGGDCNSMRITVNGELRHLSIKPQSAVLGVEGDAWMRTIEWRVPRFYDNEDLQEYRLQVHYENPAGEGGCSEAQNISIGEESIDFTWHVPPTALAKAGNTKVSFVARIVDGLVVRREYKSVPGVLHVLERMPEQDPRGDQLVDADENILVVRLDGSVDG